MPEAGQVQSSTDVNLYTPLQCMAAPKHTVTDVSRLDADMAKYLPVAFGWSTKASSAVRVKLMCVYVCVV